MLEKVNKLKNWQAAIIILLVGIVIFSAGLKNPFQGDDISQIVNNVPVHSVRNIRIFFEGSTFYYGNGLSPLSGAYYRPLMTTVFSLIYTLFGPSPIYYHLFQLLLCVGSAIILYLFFKYSFKPVLALSLSLVFLMHPINSQVAFAIPSTQDSLCIFFGMLGLYLLLRLKSIRSLKWVVLFIFLALLSKETAVLFIALALLYLFWWDRRRLLPFVGIVLVPTAIWIVLKTHAVGLLGMNPMNAPIDMISLSGRLFTVPSIVLFYLGKLVFPWKLASAYYWVNSGFSFQHFLLPLVIDSMAVVLSVYTAVLLKTRAPKSHYFTFLFFALWTMLGVLPHLQLIPLDFTTSEPWFYFPMIGILGMCGVVITNHAKIGSINVDRRAIVVFAAILLLVLGSRTYARGYDWSSGYKLSMLDIAASKEDYNAYTSVGENLIQQGEYEAAKPYLLHSISIFPNTYNYVDLGLILVHEKDYPAALAAYNNALKYPGSMDLIYEDIGQLVLVYGDDAKDFQFLLSAVHKFPLDSMLWINLALWEQEHGDNANAKIAIQKAANLGQVPQTYYAAIMNNQPFSLNLENSASSSSVAPAPYRSTFKLVQ